MKDKGQENDYPEINITEITNPYREPKKDDGRKTLFWMIVGVLISIAGIVISILIAHHVI